ncbi:hypothetical protein [Caproiciproducens sp. CPB-2]|uniref:hypothetical protein n=1 Tax=Caproiciproducens sp. CPB-2 TaxID=3030017 RepID=UPI0023DA0DE5|nr:hypothetical protein [Caproiciproducens sp. CPB-2]MDF1496341.1 hypothetical protein [Caproiciproducens sp. CPB-2]
MAEIIDLCALQPESLDIKLPSGTVYKIPASLTVEKMVKLENLQKKTNVCKSLQDATTVLQNFAFEILSLDKTKEITMDTVRTELSDLVLLRCLSNLFNDFMENSIKGALPTEEFAKQINKQIPNSKTPLEKK